MNQLQVIGKNLRGIGKAFDAIRTEETREKARKLVEEGIGNIVPVMAKWVGNGSGASETATIGSGIAITETFVGVVGDGSLKTQRPVESKETVLTPVSDHEVELGGDKAVDIAELPVEMVGGWPTIVEIVACGLAPNRRHNRGRLPDGRIASVQRGLALIWKDGMKFRCKLVRAGGQPLYRSTV